MLCYQYPSHWPDVDFFRARFVADDLGRHPRDGAGKRHLGALLGPLATRAKVRDLDHVVDRYQHARTQPATHRLSTTDHDQQYHIIVRAVIFSRPKPGKIGDPIALKNAEFVVVITAVQNSQILLQQSSRTTSEHKQNDRSAARVLTDTLKQISAISESLGTTVVAESHSVEWT